MSEQARIIAEMHKIVMSILKNGSASVAEADKIDELEALLYQQKCYKEIDDHSEHVYQGEEIATLFFNDHYMDAINKMCECEITPDDFFGFAQYHYDDEHEDEDLAEMFTGSFIAGVNEAYELKCKSKPFSIE
ncbi:hypothetical protein HUE87_06645 [Candidatus Sulfurimonas marisnigri]|uniref:Uncharacterized protein n=1 Tax=Candidatus Sulfurimonas marisnigri TaxID=2740405 RepID=A0A7S7LYE5_9BACT|nr:hypothetical protein [Candidatus Sulfurimonas marisnigri]QOY53600.1 hypothetical protein HUE87_06645 [Candidatus Sulfurimonas marisnigri]